MAYGPGDPKPGERLASSKDASREVKMLKVVSKPAPPEGLLFALDETDRATEKRVASTLQKLGKTLILESTRGAKDVAVYRRAAPAVVFVLAGKENGKILTGSGAIIDSKGHVITNWHVVEKHPRVVVVFKPKNSADLKKELAFVATVEKVDQIADLALLKIDNPPKAFATLRLGNISTLAVGQDVHAIGHPEGAVWTYTKGIISQIRSKYKWSYGEGIVHYAKVIQTQTPINPGNSGGPLLDDKGRLIGINSFRSVKGEGLNYAVAVDVVRVFLKRAGSRRAAPFSRRTEATREGKLKCPETYSRQVWSFVGCYVRASAPPPDFWLVAKGNQFTYAAWDSASVGQINRVIVKQNEQENYHFIDVDCDGTVDVIGHKYASKEQIDRYRVPDEPVRLVTLAKELDSALKTRRIPYTKLRVCQ